MTMIKCRLANLLLSILGLAVIVSPGVKGQLDENGIFIDAGGSGFTDEYGNKWLPDTQTPGHTPSGGRYRKKNARISGTKKGDEVLYRSERFQNRHKKSMDIVVGDIQPGLYEVRLHFAEIYFTAVNKRIFDVWVQEIEIYNDLDIFALVGNNTALTINAATRVTEDDNNEIRIRLDREKQNPKINGIEIRPIVEVEGFRPIYINCGGPAFTDPLGRYWAEDEYYDEKQTLKWQSRRSQKIKNTNFPELYRTERFATKDLKYEIPVPPGSYKLKLHLAEIYFTRVGSSGKRVFDVFIQDAMASKGVDIYKDAGPNTAYQLDVPAVVGGDGKLKISLQPQKNSNGTPKGGQYPKISGIEIQEIKEVYQWNNYGRRGLTLVVMNALDQKWSRIFDDVVDSWTLGTSVSQDRTMNLLSVDQPHDPDCVAVPGRIKVCNGDYGDTKWVGLNTVTLQDGFIRNSVARMNDFYLSRSTADQQIYAMCHEMGHACGLPHTDEDYFNGDGTEPDCLDYTLRPENNKKPGPFNFQLLEQLYGSLDPNRKLQDDGVPADDTPEDVKELIDDVVTAMKTTSCRQFAATAQRLQVTQLDDIGEEACEVDLPGGYSVQIRKLLATNWDLFN